MSVIKGRYNDFPC